MKLLITGGAGFIGSSLIEPMVKDNQLTVVDIREKPNHRGRVFDNVSYRCGDICDNRFMKNVMDNGGIDGIIHLAAVSRVITAEMDRKRCVVVNSEGTRWLMNACASLDTPPWVIYGSSREVYGEPSVIPVSEEHPVNPKNAYGSSKKAAETIVTEYSTQKDVPALIFRFSNVFGSVHDYPTRVIPAFIRAAITNKRLRLDGKDHCFDFTHISDVARIICKAAEYLQGGKIEGAEVVNLLPGQGTTLMDLVHHLGDISGKELGYYTSAPRTYDVERFIGCPKKLESLLGERCHIPVKDGLKMYYREFERFLTNEGEVA